MFPFPQGLILCIVYAIMFVAGPLAALAVVLGGLLAVVRKHLWNFTRSSIAIAIVVFFCGMLWIADIPAVLASLAPPGDFVIIIFPAQFLSSMFLIITLTVQIARRAKRGPLITILAVAQLVTSALCVFGFCGFLQEINESMKHTNSQNVSPQELKIVPAAPPLRQR